jgi:hypothetical protein
MRNTGKCFIAKKVNRDSVNNALDINTTIQGHNPGEPSVRTWNLRL